jgi:hypothetical protein
MLIIFMPPLAGQETSLGRLVHAKGLSVSTRILASKIGCSVTNPVFRLYSVGGEGWLRVVWNLQEERRG